MNDAAPDPKTGGRVSYQCCYGTELGDLPPELHVLQAVRARATR